MINLIFRNKWLLVSASTATLLSNLWLLPAKAVAKGAPTYDQMYVFGDSLSDTHNVYNLTHLPPSPYFDGRFSDGLIWVDYVAKALNLNPIPITELTPSNGIGGINFAFSGAKSGWDNIDLPPGAPQTGLLAQIATFRSLLNQQPVNPNALYSVFAGINDFIALSKSGLLPNKKFKDTSEITVNNVLQSLQSLAEAGAHQILVFDLPNLNTIPYAQTLSSSESKSLKKLSEEYNKSLNKGLKELSNSFPNTQFTLFSDNDMLNERIAKPKKFGFTNVTDSCLSVQLIPCTNPNEYLFWDGGHITNSANQQLAAVVLEKLGVGLSPKALPTPELNSTAFGVLAAQSSNAVPTPEPNSTWGLFALGGLLGISSVLMKKNENHKDTKDTKVF